MVTTREINKTTDDMSKDLQHGGMLQDHTLAASKQVNCKERAVSAVLVGPDRLQEAILLRCNSEPDPTVAKSTTKGMSIFA